MSFSRTSCAVLALLIAASIAPASAQAHANLVRTEPANGAVLGRPPAVVRVAFDDRVTPAPGVAVVRNGGGSVLAGRASTAPGDARILVIPLKHALRNGDYSVRWRIVSDDGHLEAGVLAFAVGAGRAPPTPTLSAGGGTSARTAIVRWLFFAGLLIAVGVAAFQVLVWRPLLRASDRALVEERAARAFAGLLFAGFVLACAGSLGLLEFSHAAGASRFHHAFAAGAVVAAVGAALAALAWWLPLFRLPASLAAVVLLPVPTLAGHALDRGQPALSVVADVLHLTAAGAWLGGLLALALAVPRAGAVLEPVARTTLYAAAARRFSAVALAWVAVLAATGAVRAWWELARVSQLWSSGYGRVIAVKTALLLALVAVGWHNRYRLVPRLAAASGSNPAGLRIFRRLRLNVVAEIAVFAGLVVAVSVLTQLRPGRSANAAPSRPVGTVPAPPQAPPRGALVDAGEARDLAVALAARPAGRKAELTATVLGGDGGGANGLAIRFRVRSPAGTTSVPALPCGPGCYRASAPAPPRFVSVEIAGRGRVPFALGAWPPRPGARLVARVTRAFEQLRSVAYVEQLSSGLGPHLTTLWRLEAPNRIEYRIRGGAAGILIGGRRWDRDGPTRPWVESVQSSPGRAPAPPWTRAVDAHVTGTVRQDGRSLVRVTFVDPGIPAWFALIVDPRTLRPVDLRMTAAAHFMRHTYVAFNAPRQIRPPGR